MKISARSLSRCVVRNGGERIALRLIDDSGEPIELDVSASDASAIAATLPQMLTETLRNSHRKNNLRQVMPLEGWQIEPTPDGSQIMMTLTADGGFQICFSTEPEACASLVSALKAGSR